MRQADEPVDEENTHSAADRKACVRMGKRYGWQLLRVERSGNDVLAVKCIFKGEQTSFAEMDPYADLD